MYTYLVFEGRLGLILNPDAEQTEPWQVAFSPTDVRPVDEGEWFGEYDSPFANFMQALAFLREQGHDLAPVGQAVPYPTPPYAGAWDGGASFSRSICCGNFWFGGDVQGERRPVWIYTGEGNDLWAAYEAVEPVTITAEWRGGHSRSVVVPAGAYWCQRYQDRGRAVLAAFPRVPRNEAAPVDVLGRW